MAKEGGRARIWFGVPSPSALSSEGYCGVDMHCHTRHSDAPVRIADALGLAERMGIGIAITDHNTVSGSLDALRNAGSVPVIPGIEVSALDGPHILVYFFSGGDLSDFHRTFVATRQQKSPYLAIRATTAEVLEAAEGYACVCSAAHPYGYLLFNKGIGRCVEREYLPVDLISRFDAIEVISGGMARSANLSAIRMAERFHLGCTGGSDAHLLRDYGRVLTFAPSGTVEEVLDAVVKNRNFVMGREMSSLGKGLAGALIAPHYLPHLLPSLAIHYEQNLPRLRRFFRRR